MLKYLAVNPFTDASSPWYYVVGVIFLVLVFAALAVYVTLSNRRKKKLEEKNKAETPTEDDATDRSDAIVTAETDTSSENKETESEPTPENNQEIEAETVNTAETETEQQSEQTLTESAQTENKSEEKADEKPTEIAEDANSEQKIEEKAPEKTEPTAKPAPKKAAVRTGTATKSAKAKQQKPFIDRLIATKAVHGIYNELKNTILSYPGMKAKITKTDEQFVFGTETKANITLGSADELVLKLYIKPENVPSQFEVERDSADSVAVAVSETRLDSAEKLIKFVMNVALLTRNERHRHTDYIQNAINAKKKAASKK